MAPSLEGPKREGSPIREEVATGPMAICFDEKLGWVTETLGLKSGQWKCLARKDQTKMRMGSWTTLTKRNPALYLFWSLNLAP